LHLSAVKKRIVGRLQSGKFRGQGYEYSQLPESNIRLERNILMNQPQLTDLESRLSAAEKAKVSEEEFCVHRRDRVLELKERRASLITNFAHPLMQATPVQDIPCVDVSVPCKEEQLDNLIVTDSVESLVSSATSNVWMKNLQDGASFTVSAENLCSTLFARPAS